MKPSRTRKSTYPNLKANLLMTLLAIGVPIGTKLVLLNARAAASQQVLATDAMSVARHDHTATLLPNGTVLIAGGLDASNAVVASAEVYDPSANGFSSAGDMRAARVGHTVTLLSDGRALVAGGETGSGPANSIEVFDPASGTFADWGLMSVARRGHTASILTDGRILIAGGDRRVREDGSETSTAEIIDPANPLWVSPVYEMTEPRSGHSATLLNNSLVYMAGGNANPSAELFDTTDPDNVIFSTIGLAIPQMTTARIGHTAIIGPDNKIYLFGGDASGSVEMNDPYTGTTSTNLGTLAISPLRAVKLANDKVLVIGTADAGVFNPNPPYFDSLTNVANGDKLLRAGATATELNGDKKILVAGGVDANAEPVGPAVVFNPATVATDLDDYPPFSFVDIFGTGFLPGETVNNQIVQVEGPAVGTAYAPWDAVVDPDGNYHTNWYVFTDDLIGTTLELTATGQTSRLVSKATFADAGPIAQRGSATTATTTSSSLTINKPTGVVAGDVMIVNIAKVNNDITTPTLTGWTLVDGKSLTGTGSTLRYGAVLYRVADGTEGASFVFALGTSVNSAVGNIVAFSGVDTTGGVKADGTAGGPFDVDPGTILVNGSGSTSVGATATTTASANAAVFMFGMAASGTPPTWSGWTTTSPGALTELYDNQSSDASVGAAWATKATAGSTGAGAAS